MVAALLVDCHKNEQAQNTRQCVSLSAPPLQDSTNLRVHHAAAPRYPGYQYSVDSYSASYKYQIFSSRTKATTHFQERAQCIWEGCRDVIVIQDPSTVLEHIRSEHLPGLRREDEVQCRCIVLNRKSGSICGKMLTLKGMGRHILDTEMHYNKKGGVGSRWAEPISTPSSTNYPRSSNSVYGEDRMTF